MTTRIPLPKGYLLDGRYRIEGKLGEGGFSLVYLARHLDRLWAVKEVFDADRCERNATSHCLEPKDGQARIHHYQIERARQEWSRFSTLRHPNIVDIVDGFDALNSFYLVMPFVEGEDLQVRVDRAGALPMLEIENVLSAISSALTFLHKQGVIHRDIKPDNIWLRKADNTPLLLDTGAARDMEDAQRISTAIWTPLGAPELRGSFESSKYGAVGPAADVFAFGGVLVVMLSGREAPEVGVRMGRQDDDLAGWEIPSCPETTQVLRKALNLKVAARYWSIPEFERALGAALGRDHSVRASAAGPTRPPARPAGAARKAPDGSPVFWGVAVLSILVMAFAVSLAFPAEPLLAALGFLVVHTVFVMLNVMPRRNGKRQALTPLHLVPFFNIYLLGTNKP